MVQVERLGRAVLVYLPYSFLSFPALEQLSARGVVASFCTTIELDTYVIVAWKRTVVRELDGASSPRAGAPPAPGEGARLGKRKQNVWALTHVSQEWFEGEHPTYVLDGS